MVSEIRGEIQVDYIYPVLGCTCIAPAYSSKLGKIVNASPSCAPWFASAQPQVWISIAAVSTYGFLVQLWGYSKEKQ